MTDQHNIESDGGKVDGRTKAARTARAAARTGSDDAARSLARGQYVGRNGEVLSRTNNAGIDQFAIPEDLKERDWDYQWIPLAVLGNADIIRSKNAGFFLNGWRPVQAVGRWNGRYMPENSTGHIVVEDVGLYERPLQMSVDARNEELRLAQQQIRDRDQALMGGKANLRNNMQGGFEMGGKYRGTGARLDMRMSIDPALDGLRPSYQPADD